MDRISVIVPCYNEEKVLPLFYKETEKVLRQIEGAEYEWIFIDDGSKDHTVDLLKSFVHQNPHCKYISFSRNFGKEAAMYAGLQNASGDYCVLMDADLQHPPALLPEMYHVLKTEGYDCCAGFREDREGEKKFRSFLSRKFYQVMKRMCHLEMDDGAGDFRMMKRNMVDSILQIKEYNRYMKGIFSFVGFETKWIPFHNVERAAGETKWSLISLFRYALDGIFSFSTAPVSLAGAAGVILFLISAAMGVYIAMNTILFGNDVSGFTTIVCLILFLNGIQMLFISILGEYISKDYMENKRRPIYIVKKSEGF